jgi:uncharacterized membrane protein YhhN
MQAVYVLGLAVAVVDWIAVARGNRRLEYVVKPAVMVILILGLILVGQVLPTTLGWLFLGGLIFSLLGDVLLMLPANRFLLGLLAFLAAHVLYVVAFNLEGLVLSVPSAALALLVAAIAIPILLRVRRALQAAARSRLWPPVAVYGIVLGLTLWSTLCTLLRPTWPTTAAALVTLGGVLFFTSDALNAWERFVNRFRNSRVLVMVSYHLAQYLLAAGVVLAIAAGAS